MNELSVAIDMAMQEFKRVHGENAKWEVGDNMAIVCDDAVITIEMLEGRELRVNCIIGKPYKIDMKLNLLKATAESED